MNEAFYDDSVMWESRLEKDEPSFVEEGMNLEEALDDCVNQTL